ncbi:MAG: transcriptional regulator [Candidatus Tectimicrobiota bacterium]|nr:MAG: transcriptional regulator [Candidatus Tectomicrobia bacterium]
MPRRLSPEALALVAARFKALGEPTRLRLLQALEEGEQSVSALAARLGTTQPNVSKHLKVLHAAGLVRRRQVGSAVYYAIADEHVFELCDLVCARLQAPLAAPAGAPDGPLAEA